MKENNNMSNQNNASTKVITSKQTRISYANLFEPKGFEDSKPVYSASLIIPKDDKRTLAQIQNAIEAAYENGQYKLRGNGKLVPALGDINSPLNDGDKKRPNDSAYANAYYINAKNPDQPKLFDADRNPIIDRSEIYSGIYGRASITFYAYNRKGNKGIACSLHGIQKVADGKPLGGSICTADDFAVDEEDDGEDFLS